MRGHWGGKVEVGNNFKSTHIISTITEHAIHDAVARTNVRSKGQCYLACCVVGFGSQNVRGFGEPCNKHSWPLHFAVTYLNHC
jgi:hypothetical protein